LKLCNLLVRALTRFGVIVSGSTPKMLV